MQPQPSLRVVHGSIVWRQHMGGAHWGAKMGGDWGGEAFLRPFLHWQCQLGTVPYTVPYFTVITVKYGVTITVVRRNLTSAVRTVQTVIVPHNSISLICMRGSVLCYSTFRSVVPKKKGKHCARTHTYAWLSAVLQQVQERCAKEEREALHRQ